MMETELSFLITLLLEHKLPKVTKELVKERIKGLQGTQVFVSAPRPPIQQSRPTVAMEAPEAVSAMPRLQGGEVTTGQGTRGPRKF